MECVNGAVATMITRREASDRHLHTCSHFSARNRAEQLPIRTYTTADGLPRDRVYKIVPDPRGFLWFCTYDGLSRFDGYEL